MASIIIPVITIVSLCVAGIGTYIVWCRPYDYITMLHKRCSPLLRHYGPPTILNVTRLVFSVWLLVGLAGLVPLLVFVVVSALGEYSTLCVIMLLPVTGFVLVAGYTVYMAWFRPDEYLENICKWYRRWSLPGRRPQVGPLFLLYARLHSGVAFLMSLFFLVVLLMEIFHICTPLTKYDLNC